MSEPRQRFNDNERPSTPGARNALSQAFAHAVHQVHIGIRLQVRLDRPPPKSSALHRYRDAVISSLIRKLGIYE